MKPLVIGLLKGIFDSVMRAVLAYRFQRKTQAELAFMSAIFGDFFSNSVRIALFSVTANTFEYVFAHLAPKKHYQYFS